MFCCILFYVALILLIIKVYVKLTTGICRSNTCLIGKTALITGSNTGLGYNTALDFAKRGAKVILACRDKSRGEKARAQIIEITGNTNIHLKLVDLTSFQSVAEFADDIVRTEERLDILVNNAGVTHIPDLTVDGLPTIMQVNHFSHFLLTNKLLSLLKQTGNSRIVNVSSTAAGFSEFDVHNPNEDKTPLKMYGNSKIAQILFTRELARRLQGTSVTVYSLHPGVVLTEFLRNYNPIAQTVLEFGLNWFFKDGFEGAQTQIYCAVEKDLEQYSGRHFADCGVARDYSRVKKLLSSAGLFWDKSEEVCKKYLNKSQ